MGAKERVDCPVTVKGTNLTTLKIVVLVIVFCVITIAGIYCLKRTVPAMLVNVVATGVELKREIGLINQEVDETAYPDGMSVSDVYEISSPESKAATHAYGAGRNVYVLSTDPELRYLLANYRDRKYEVRKSNKPNKMPYTKKGYERFNDPISREILDITEEQWGRFATYLTLTDPHVSAAVEIYESDGGQHVVFLRSDSTSSLLRKTSIPYVTPLSQVNQWSLPHELGHSWDFELLDRKHDVRHGGSANEEQADLIGESIADLTTALILLRETGNNDTLNYQIIPFRTRTLKDHIHATQYLLGKTYGRFTVSQVAGKSDFDLSRLAIEAINKEVDDSPEDLRRFLAEHKQNARDVSKMSGADRELAMRAGRDMLNGSLNNVIYHDKLHEQCKALLGAVEKQITSFDDRKLDAALAKNPFFCDDQTKQADALKKFASDAGFTIDWASHERFEANARSVDAYYDSLIK